MKALSVTFGTTPIAGAVEETSSAVRTVVIEALLVVIAIATLLPGFAALATHASGRDGRFAEAIVGVSHLVRTAATGDAKDAAMRALLGTAGWQWAGWMLAGFLLLQLSRRAGFAVRGIALGLIVAAASAWLGRVPLPLATGHAFVLGRESTSLLSMPAPFVLALAAAGALLLLCAPRGSRALATGAQRPSSVFAYPGLVFATGIGWLIMLDLSANGHPGNRYLALYHQGHLWAGMLAFSVVAFARQPLGRALSWTLSMLDGSASRVAARCGAAGSAAILIALLVVLIGLIGALLLNVRQLTSELGRLWLIVGAAWFFFMRGTPLTERLIRSGTSIGSLVRYVWPLLFVVAVLIGAMLVTHDMGPLLIAGYGAGA